MLAVPGCSESQDRKRILVVQNIGNFNTRAQFAWGRGMHVVVVQTVVRKSDMFWYVSLSIPLLSSDPLLLGWRRQ